MISSHLRLGRSVFFNDGRLSDEMRKSQTEMGVIDVKVGRGNREGFCSVTQQIIALITGRSVGCRRRTVGRGRLKRGGIKLRPLVRVGRGGCRLHRAWKRGRLFCCNQICSGVTCLPGSIVQTGVTESPFINSKFLNVMRWPREI